MTWRERVFIPATFFAIALVGAVLAGVFPVGAADLRIPNRPVNASLASTPGCQWCGLYFGVSGGYGGADFIANFDDSSPDADIRSFSSKHSANSFLGGAHIGYNYQFGSIVVGAETDISATGIKANANGVESTLPWFGTTRLRFGLLPTPDLLIYGTGGVAYGHVRVGDVTGGSGVVATTPTVGWTLGGGLEYKLVSNITIGAEYLHVDLDGPSVTNGFQTIGTRVPADVFRGRLSLQF
jgi:outer membrane immunogenic protein